MPKILIVEDSKTIVKIVSYKLLKERIYTLDVANSFQEAEKLIESENYFLAISCLNLIDAPNEEIIDYIISKGLPLIVLTGSYDDETRNRIVQKNICDYILKRGEADYDYLINIINSLYRHMNTKVLIVDDSITLRKEMKMILENSLLKVITTNNGKEALAILKENPDIKLLLTDYLMPEMDGIQLVAEVRKNHPRETLSIIAVSSIEDFHIIPMFLKYGANDFMRKPLNREEFLARVNIHLDNLYLIEQIKTISYRDSLTGVYNSSYFFDTAKKFHSHALRSGYGMAIGILDIDKMDAINYAHGNPAGDFILKNIAKKLDSKLKRGSDILARFKDDKFLILINSDNTNNFYNYMENIRNDIFMNTFFYKETELKITVSVGLCINVIDSFDEMIGIADKLVNEAKANGGNTVLKK